MEQRLSVVTLGVADLERALRFYEALGWKRGNKHPEVVFFQLNGMVLALFSRERLAADAQAAGRRAAASAASRSPTARAAARRSTRSWREAEARGARILKPRRGRLLGRLFRLFRRPGRPPLGGRLEPGMGADGGGKT